jgi:hypothetical protein
VSYSFSKTLDTSGGGSNGISSPQNSYNANADRGLSDINRKNVLNFNYICNLPFFAKHSSGLVRNTLGGWEIAGVTSFQSGSPFSVIVPKDVAAIGVASTHATATANPNLPASQRTLTKWFNASAFLLPAQMTPGQFGTSGRNILIGPGFQTWDLALIKNAAFAAEKIHFSFAPKLSTSSITPISAASARLLRSAPPERLPVRSVPSQDRDQEERSNSD